MICIIAHNKWKSFIGNSWNCILSAQRQQMVLTFSLFSSNSLPPLTRQTAVHAWLTICAKFFWLSEQSFHIFDGVWTTEPCYRMCKNPLNAKHTYLNVKLQNSNPDPCIKPNMDVSFLQGPFYSQHVLCVTLNFHMQLIIVDVNWACHLHDK